MASTYDNSLRLELIATGEAASTWGDKTNVNLTAIAAAFGYATQDGFAADANATTTVADGAADPARALYFKITSSATLTATRTLTIAPNTISRVMWIENATTGSQSIAISQGSGANVTIPAGKTAVVYLDGAGAGAAVVDAMASLNIDGSISAGAATFSGEITANGGIALGDNDKATFGASDDLQIYHDGSNNRLDSVSSSLVVKAPQFVVQDAEGTKNMIWVPQGGSGYEVQLSHDGTTKLTTTATGIDVTGTATMDGLTVDGGGSLTFSELTSKIIGPLNQDFIIQQRGNADTEALRIQNLDNNNLAKFDKNGDINFYNTTGTTAKFFWDASAESLTVPDMTIGSSDATSKRLIFQGNGGVGYEGGINWQRDAAIDNSITVDSSESLSINFAQSDLAGRALLFKSGSAGTERMRIDGATGNVGIGTSSTNGLKTVIKGATGYPATSGTTQTGVLRLSGGVGLYNVLDMGVNEGADSSWIQATRANSLGTYDKLLLNPYGGNVGIGVTNCVSSLTLGNPSADGTVDYTKGIVFTNTLSGTSNDWVQAAIVTTGSTAFNGNLIFATDGDGIKNNTTAGLTERMRIDSAGRLCVNTSSDIALGRVSIAAGLYNTDIGMVIKNTNTTYGSNTSFIDFRNSGNAIAGRISHTGGTTVNYGTSSDERLKTNIQDADDAGDLIDSIRVRKFDWIADGTHQDYGMVAQELNLIAPLAAPSSREPDDIMSVDYSKLVPMMLKEIQSLRARIAILEGA